MTLMERFVWAISQSDPANLFRYSLQGGAGWPH
ncbi:hypothetical protein P3T43_002182 [Paraburkholderia sp. GAS41]|jgi:hypothetical protein